MAQAKVVICAVERPMQQRVRNLLSLCRTRRRTATATFSTVKNVKEHPKTLKSQLLDDTVKNVKEHAKTLISQLLDDTVPFWSQRKAISQTITLLESQLPQDQALAHEVVTLLHHQHNPCSIRVGIAGSPGAGKSTFLEALGQHILTASSTERLAILCIDPSSAQTTGSILADKTRMPTLAYMDRCLIRPCPSRTILGGLAPQTESVCRLMAAVFPTVFVETVGLGQSELDIQHVTDCVLYLVPPNSGDDLQAVKQGILEVADAVVVTKADGSSLQAAKRTAAEYRGALNVSSRNKERPVFLTSAVSGEGLAQVWDFLETQKNHPPKNSNERRLEQDRYWTRKHLHAAVVERVEREYNKLHTNERDVSDLPPRVAAHRLIEKVWDNLAAE